MTEINYLERPNEKDTFNSVMGMVDYLSTSANSPFVSSSGHSQKKFVATAKTRDQHQVSNKQDETRDDCSKRVMFHPDCIVGVDSGEDLNFDPTKVYNAKESNDNEQRDRGILTNSNSVIPSEKNSNLTANQVYVGMSRRCSHILQDDESNTSKARRGRATQPKKESFLQELKIKVPLDNDGQAENKFANRWKTNSQSEQVKKVLDDEIERFTSGSGETKRLMSPKKFSVSKINKARNAPVPKSDDFFSELKRWHKDYALRQVERPQEISIITKQGMVVSNGNDNSIDPKKSEFATKKELKEAKKKEEEKKAETKRELKKAAAEAKDVLAKQKKKKKQMKKDAKRMEKRNKVDGSVSSKNDDRSNNEMSLASSEKEKKKFWKLPIKSKRKQKTDGSACSNSTADESSKSPKVASLNYTSLGMEKSPRKVPMRDPEEKFHETLDKFLKLQIEMREDEGSAESEAKKSNELALVAETVDSTEEKESNIVDVTKGEYDIERKEQSAPTSTDENNSSTKTDDIEVVGVQKSNPKEQKGSWLGKASGLFKKDRNNNPSTAVTVLNETQESSQLQGQTNGTEELLDKTTPCQESKEKPTENDAWLGQITGLFKKDDNAIPPVSVVKVDKFDVDKYESVAESEPKSDGSNEQVAQTEGQHLGQENITKTESDVKLEETVQAMAEKNREKPNSRLVPNFVVNSYQSEGVVRPVLTAAAKKSQQEEENTALTEEEEEGFLQTNCPCMPHQQQELSTESTKNDKEEQDQPETVAESSKKELSWFEMATDFFATVTTPKQEELNATVENKEEGIEENAAENPSTTESTHLNTPKVSNNRQAAFFSEDDDAPKESEKGYSSFGALMMPEPAKSETFDDSHSSLEPDRTQSGTFDDSLLTSQEGTFDDSLLTKEEVKSGSFDDSLITLEEGTKLTRIEPAQPMETSRLDGLLDVEASKSASFSLTADKDGQQKKEPEYVETIESRSCADSQPKEGAVESNLCVDPTSQATKPDPPSSTVDDQSKSRSASINHSFTADVASCVDSKSKSKSSKSSGIKQKMKKRISKPTDIVFFKKNKKNVDGADDEQGTARAVISSRFSSSSTIFDFSPEDSENCGQKGNQNSGRSAALPPLVMKIHMETAEKVAKQPRRAAVTKHRTKKKEEGMGATLFGRLEPVSDAKKRKKKAKRSQTLF